MRKLIILTLTLSLFGCKGTLEVEQGGVYDTQYGEAAPIVAAGDIVLRDVYATMIDFLGWCDRNPEAMAGSLTLRDLRDRVQSEITPPSEPGEIIHTYLLLRRAYDISKDPTDQQALFNQSKILSDFVFQLTQIMGGS